MSALIYRLVAKAVARIEYQSAIGNLRSRRWRESCLVYREGCRLRNENPTAEPVGAPNKSWPRLAGLRKLPVPKKKGSDEVPWSDDIGGEIGTLF